MAKMSTNVSPVPNTWYVNKSGKLIKVKMMAFKGHEISRIMIEFLEGTTQLVDFSDWARLDLERHAWVPSGTRLSLKS